MQINASKTTIIPGETLKVTIGVGNLYSQGGFKVAITQLSFDPNIFEYESGQVATDIVGLNGFSIVANEANGKITATNSAYIEEPTDICTISLKVKDTAVVGQNYEIKTVGTDIADGNLDTLDVTEATRNVAIKNISVKDGSGLTLDNDKISGVKDSTKASDLLNGLTVKNGTAEVVDKNNQTVDGNTIVGTGMKVKTSDGSYYTIIVKGDLNGDGLIDIADTTAMKLHIVELRSLTGAYLDAADIDDNGIHGNAVDLARLVNYQIKLSQTL